MKLEINIPTELSDITLRQYQKFLKTQEQVKSMTELQCIMIEIFCNLRPDMAKLMNFNQVEKITAELTAMFNDTPPLVQRFTMNGVEYGFIPELDDMTLGEYIDLDTYISDIDSLQVAMNVLYRPIVHKHKHKYTIKDYDPTTKNAMLNMPLDAVLSSMFFFSEFRNGLINNYPEIFDGGQGDTTSSLSQFQSKYGWFHSIWALSGGDITKVKDITKLNMHECLMMLAYIKDKNELEAKQIKNNIR